MAESGMGESGPPPPEPPLEPPSPLPSASPLDRTFLTGLPGVTTMLLIRHGKQLFPQRQRAVAADWVDPPLSDLGQRQAEALGWALAREAIDVVYASPLIRALTTAREVAKHHDLEPTIVDDLREVELFRELPDGKNLTDLIGIEELRRLQERFIVERRWDVYPFSESSAEFRARVIPAIDAIAARHPGQCVAVACHSGVTNGYVAHCLGLGEDMIFRAAHASVNRVLVGYDRRVVHSLNETHHLSQVDPALVTV
ncbi:MAG TPA: histidine phosphatase family protein [Acidimicrobiales bacterium]|nr:histidine phosphatase family protein [Acidimicrobiales bacterium]